VSDWGRLKGNEIGQNNSFTVPDLGEDSASVEVTPKIELSVYKITCSNTNGANANTTATTPIDVLPNTTVTGTLSQDGTSATFTFKNKNNADITVIYFATELFKIITAETFTVASDVDLKNKIQTEQIYINVHFNDSVGDYVTSPYFGEEKQTGLIKIPYNKNNEPKYTIGISITTNIDNFDVEYINYEIPDKRKPIYSDSVLNSTETMTPSLTLEMLEQNYQNEKKRLQTVERLCIIFISKK